jgi:hypothetical protein
MIWEPRPHEADLFREVYIDESSQSDHHYLVMGGLIVPMSHSKAFEASIIAARDHIIKPAKEDGTPRVIKWEKVSTYNLASYRKVVDAFFVFEQQQVRADTLNKTKTFTSEKRVNIHCVAVDTRKKSLKKSGAGDIDIGFNKELYFLCTNVIGKLFPKELFHLYPDRRTTPHSLDEALLIMNRGAAKYGDKRDWPYRRLRFADPEHFQALQVVDIFIGALAYHLNGHRNNPKANAAKKELSDYIIKLAKMKNPFATTPIYHPRRFTVVHRPYEKAITGFGPIPDRR